MLVIPLRSEIMSTDEVDKLIKHRTVESWSCINTNNWIDLFGFVLTQKWGVWRHIKFKMAYSGAYNINHQIKNRAAYINDRPLDFERYKTSKKVYLKKCLVVISRRRTPCSNKYSISINLKFWGCLLNRAIFIPEMVLLFTDCPTRNLCVNVQVIRSKVCTRLPNYFA